MDEEGNPKNAELIQKFADQQDYIKFVREEERRNEGNSYHLSKALGDSQRQQLITAMRLYQSGKAGWYSKLIDKFLS